MKENGYGKMIDQNWVMKRKRKRHLSGHEQLSGKDKVSIPSESPRNNLPSKERLKLDTVTASSGSPGKKKGYDGYYYECVVCDLRGNLLCCDSCPRTYHLQCLSPPLKNTPPGKWHCPNCCDLSGSVRSVRDSESPRPVRKKSAISSKFTSSSMVSQALKLGKKKSSGKGRPDVSIKVPSLLDSSQQNLSYRTRSSNVSLGGADGGTSPCANIQIEKSNLSCGDISDNRESSSADMDLQSHNRILPDDESSERKIDISSSTKSSNHMLTSTQGSTRQKTRKKKQKFKKVLGPNDESLERFDFPCSIGSPEDVITAKHCASKKSRKKKQKVNLLLELNDESLKMDFDLSCKSKSSEVIVNSTMGGLTVEATKKKQKVNQVLEVNDDFSDKKPDIPCSAGSPQELLSSTLGDAIQKTMKSKQKDDKVSEPKNESSDKISDLSCGIGSPQKMQNCKSDSATQKAKKRKRNVNKMLEQNESSKSKSDLPCSGESQRATFNHTPDSATKVSQKRKQKFNKEDDGKRSSALKENSGVKTSEICRSKATSGSPGTNKACRKRSPLGRQVSRSRSKENCGAKPKGYRHKDANLHLEASHSFKELAELGVDVDNTMICEENAHIEVRQVHKILGCRVQISQPLAACVGQPVKSPVSSTDGVSLTNSTSVASDLPNLPIPQNHGGLLLKETVDPKDVAVVTVEGFQDALKQSDCGKCNEIDIKEDHIHTSRGTRANECIEGGDAIPSTRDLNGHGPSSVGIGVQDESFAGDTHCMRTEQVDMKENNNVGIVRLSTRVEELNAEDAVPDIELNAEENKAEELIFGTANATVGDTVNYEFLVKWAGQSHIHNDWVSETQLKLLAKRKLENYKAKYGTAIINICQDEWRNPQRVLAIRSSKDGISEAFVKWYGLTYDECTWERLDEPVMRAASHLITEFQQFERQALEKDSEKDHFVSIKGEQTEISSLLEQPKELKGGSLFGHQLEALNWLRKCWHKSKNVILADEMGLGKTVSACAFISSLYVEFKARLPCLVLVPLSTMPNWLSEFALWAPHLNVVEYHGASKARAAIRQYEWHASDPDCSNKKTASYKFNVLLTTYEMVLHDSSQLRGVPWEVLVVDEGHRLKNSESKLFNALNTFSFQQRVLLTGTPLQNNIGEMYNLLNFLQTASFPSLSSFEEKFNDLTTTEKVEELKKLVSPHMLRRLKKDVMKNIPPKTERMVPVELSSIQAEYYRAMLTKNYQILRNVGKNVAQQSMLNIVMQLRKVCNHPYLIPGTEPDSGSVEFLQDMRIKASAKLTLLHSMLKVLKKEGHRVLIFSQMTKLLDILDDYLNIEFGPKTYERVDGSVSVADRQAAIARFNQDKSRFIFLLSTRSCGLGINLATADTVIIYDSDFNPHADIQAMNRAHRIGQSNRLLVYRLVVRASVEERILQLAKRKLMLDQLFVNKSGSQKEVEDILRWGTEELFSDSASVGNNCTAESSGSKIEATEPEQKHRRRIGGLGDVYKDKCTDGNPRIIWDENAILKLLDRSDLHSGSPEGADGELENDMLGSVKALEWNDEPTEEQGGTEPAPAVQMDVSIQSPEKKEDAEENEWDRLLRLRWEKYQNDEEAALGRGKRLRKAVSYSEAYAINTSETRNESGNVEDLEPEREYTPAGQALKTKFAKLRARQKEHLSRMKRMRESCPIAGELRAESLPPPETITGANVREQASSITMDDDKKSTQPLDTPEDKSDSMFKPSRALKQGLSYPLDVPFKPLGPLPPDVFLPSQQFRNPSYMNSLATDNRLPVLGLCAPNANQLQAAHRTRQDHSNLPRPKSRAGINLPQFPFCFSGAGASGETGKGKKIAEDTHMEASDVLPSRFRNSILDGCFPFSSCPPTSTLGRAHNPLESSAASFSGLQEQMALAYGQRQMPTFLHAAEDAPNSYSDLFSPLSLGIKVENSVQDAPTMPLLPNFRMPPLDLPKLNSQLKELPPMLSLGQMRPPYSSLPENHKKVLDNIMMRTECGPGSNNHFKKKLKVVAWSEDELDALWVGVRRHGRGNWDAILRDPKLKFSIYRTCDDLSARWEKEEVKIFNEPASIASNSAAVRYNKSSLPGISGGMMTRALQGSKPPGLGTDHCLPPNFKSHLTDMHLGHSDLISGLLPGELSHGFALQNERSNSLQSNFTKDFPSLLSEGPGSSSNFQLERQVLLNSMESRGLGSMSMNSFNLQQQNQDPLGANKYAKLPNYMDRSLNSLRDCRTNLRTGEYTSSELMHDQMKLNFGLFSHPVAKDDVVSGSSTMNQLPHWLREAINVPPRPAESELPPTVSAIAHSVRLLYGAEKPAIPPFTIPSPPPSQPKDPRKDLKKKKRFLKHKHRTSDTATSTKNFPSHLLGDDSASCSAVQPAPSLPPTAANTSGFPWIQPNLTLPSLGLNPLNSPSPPSYPSHLNKLGTGLSPSPEVLQLVASCVVSRNQEQECPSLPGIAPTTKILESSLTSSNPSESVDGEKSDMKSIEGKGKDIFSPPIVGDNDSCVLLPAETARPTESGDSSKKSSDPCRIDGRAEVEEKSPEKTSSIELIKQTEEVEK